MSSPKLSFGYIYDFRNPRPWRRNWSELYAETLDVIASTETMGFEGAWLPEHHLSEDGYMPSPIVALSAVAAQTKTIRLGSAIALAPLYHPLRFAQDCAVLDTIANGRAEMSLAIGYRKRETAAFGVDFRKRGRMFDDFLDIVQRLWAGETVTHHGDFYTLENASILPTPPRGRIPLYIGGFADKALARVAKYADGYAGNEETCGAYVDKLREQGKDPASARIRLTGLFLAVATDPAAAMEELAPYYHHVNNSYGAFMNEDQALGLDSAALAPMDLDSFKASGILTILTPEQAIAMFRGLQARMPVEHYMMMMPPGLPAERFRHYAELFAREVIPAFT